MVNTNLIVLYQGNSIYLILLFREVDPLLDDSDTENTARAKNKSTSNNRPLTDLNPADQ